MSERQEEKALEYQNANLNAAPYDAFLDGYQYAVDKFCELLEKNMFEKYEFDEYGDITETYACSDSCEYVSEFVEQMRKAMGCEI